MPDKKPKTFGYREEVLEAMLKLLGPYDDVTRDNMFGFPAFRASGQIFACVYQNGISLKMPKAAAEAIVQTPGISPFIPFGRARMRQWVHIERKKPSAYIKDFPLIEASVHYVRTLKPKKSARKSVASSASARKTASAATEKSSGATPGKSAPKASAKTPQKQGSPKKSPAAPKSAPKKKTTSNAAAGKKKSSASAKTSGKPSSGKKSASRTAPRKKSAKKAAPAARKTTKKKAGRTAGKAASKGRK